jgi:TPR repeat protein
MKMIPGDEPRAISARVALTSAVLLFALAAGVVRAGGLDQFYGVSDAPSRYFPGHYFEQKARFYLEKGDYREALRLFELSGYWADKVSQYNAGIMYFNGIGVPADKARGAAWLGIAAETHDDLADGALRAAWAGLSGAQREQADAIFRQIDPKYGDAAALPRALKRYAQDARVSIFGFGVSGPGWVYTTGGRGYEENSASYRHRLDAQRDALIAQITGHVSVGGVTPLAVPERAKHDPSHAVLRQRADPPGAAQSPAGSQ